MASGRTPDSVLTVICLDACAPVTPASRTLATSLRQDLTFLSSPPALLPIGHSPSRRRLRQRWWAFTPPVRPCPICTGGIIFCCSCRQTRPVPSRKRVRTQSALTCCFVRQSCAVMRRHGESGSSSGDCGNRNRQRRNTCLPTPRINEPPGNRTLNLQLKRLLLCQLS